MRIRPAEDSELDAYVAVWNAITPDEPADPRQQRERRERDGRRLYLLAERGGEVVGCGFAGPSQSEGRGFLSPRVLPGARRAGIGTALLRELASHLTGLGFATASGTSTGATTARSRSPSGSGSRRSTARSSRCSSSAKRGSAPDPPDGVSFVTLADRPELLRESYPLATEGYADMARVHVGHDHARRLALGRRREPAGGVVRRARRRRGRGALRSLPEPGRRGRGRADGRPARLAPTRPRGGAQAGQARMGGRERRRADRHLDADRQRRDAGLNERLGYLYRSVSITVRADLPVA